MSNDDKQERDILQVMWDHKNRISRLGDAIARNDEALDNHGISGLPHSTPTNRYAPRTVPILSWDDILAKAEAAGPKLVSITDLLTADEIRSVEARLAEERGEFDAIHALDPIDWTIAGVSGVLAALVDMTLIKTPGAGWLSNQVNEHIKNLLTPTQVRALEQKYKVPYDAADNRNLNISVDGLRAGLHRDMSLGHDPMLGFIFGTADILRGTFTAIDRHGKLIIQAVDTTNTGTAGMNLFEALAQVAGHLASDVTTPAGLPAPLMPLLQFCQFGTINAFGKTGLTVSDLSRAMYTRKYNFNHFIAMSTAPMLIEVLVRTFYFAKRLNEGHPIDESLPVNVPGHHPPKLQTMLFSAHLVATTANAGKLAITKNPLGINYPQWMAFFRYALPQLHWATVGKEDERARFVQRKIDEEWDVLKETINQRWRFEPVEVITLG